MTRTMSEYDRITVSGEMQKKDAKRLTNTLRGSTVGPTTLYYAGVTAPVIGAGMALMVQAALEQVGMRPYWVTMLSAILAAFAGITWYLIFMRWSYRHRHGRSGEMGGTSTITLAEKWIGVRRGKVETRIDWSAILEVRHLSRYTLIRFDGADPLLVPNKWFGKDKAALNAFRDRLEQGRV